MNERSPITSLNSSSKWPWMFLTLLSTTLINSSALADTNCEIKLSQPHLDFGQFSQGTLIKSRTPSGHLSIGIRTISLSSSCGPDSLIELSFNATSYDESSYTFADNGKFTLKILDAQLDGREVQMRSRDRIATSDERNLIRPGDHLVPFDGQTLAIGERLNLKIEAHALIDEAQSRVNGEAIVEGQGQFEVMRL